jgi:hypothetical protein
MAAPVALIVAVGLWRSGRHSAWWFLVATALVYVGAGLLTATFVRRQWAPVIPIMVLSPLVYPVAGLVWGGLLHQAASQGYLPFLNRHIQAD